MPKPVRLLLGERSNRKPGEGSAEKILHSPTRARLDACFAGWEDSFVTRNIWLDKEDDRDGVERLHEILDEVKPDLIVSLGITVSLLLEVPYETPWLSETSAFGIPTIKFPHPSGRSRVWNDAEFAALAAARLEEAASLDVQVHKAEQPVEKAPAKRIRTPKDDRTHEVTEPKFLKIDQIWFTRCTGCAWAVTVPASVDKTPDEAIKQGDWHLAQHPTK